VSVAGAADAALYGLDACKLAWADDGSGAIYANALSGEDWAALEISPRPAGRINWLGRNGARPAFLLPSFVDPNLGGGGYDETFRLLRSDDFTTFSKVSTRLDPKMGSVRDPSLLEHNGAFYAAYTTGAFAESNSFAIARALRWDGPYLHHCAVDCSGVAGLTVRTCWSPIFFKHDDGTVHVFVSLSPNVASGDFRQYYLSALGGDLLSWSAPTELSSITAIRANTIAGFCIKKGANFHYWYKDETNKYNEVAISTSPFSGYSAYKTEDWAGWGQNKFEGAYPVYLQDRTRVFFDQYNPVGGIHYSDSFDDDETFSEPAAIDSPFLARNGLGIAA
jgi:hypothetical protein